MGDLSPHFSLAEFATCRASDRCPQPMVSTVLVCLLEEARSEMGDRPIRIVSGYRCHPCNVRVGGAPRSRHMYGDAADVPRGAISVAVARSVGFTGIGKSGTWATHVDVRPGSRSEWRYS